MTSRYLWAEGTAPSRTRSQTPWEMARSAPSTADLNHDGYLDIITVNQYSNDISVLMGNGDGTFQPAESFPAGTGPTALVVGDFNGDGRLDVAVADSGDSDGDGQASRSSWATATALSRPRYFYPAGTYPSSIVAGDFTGNGVLDLAVSQSLLRRCHGPPGRRSRRVSDTLSRFHSETRRACRCPSRRVTSRAMTCSTWPWPMQGSDNVSILEGNGHGGFTALPPVSLGDDLGVNHPIALVAGDFAGDGLCDLAVASASFDEPDNVSILLGEGQGTFRSPPPIPLGWGLAPYLHHDRPASSETARSIWRSPIPTPTRSPCYKVTAWVGSSFCRASPGKRGYARPRSQPATSPATENPTWPSVSKIPTASRLS